MQDVFLINKPLITDKATRASGEGKYFFVVKSEATKPEIRKAIKAMYKVDPTSINTINNPGKSKRFRNIKGRSSGYKKAIVTLKEGQKIDTQ